MATSANLYAVNLDEIAQAIIAGGHQRTILVQGHMGTGKSSLLNMLSARADPSMCRVTSTVPPRIWGISRSLTSCTWTTAVGSCGT